MIKNSKTILNLGAGKDLIPQAITVDFNSALTPDVVHDLNQFPWPFADNSFDEIYAKDVLEHLGNLVRVMEEIHRIARPGAKIFIVTPHYSCPNSWRDPTHQQHLSFFSFDYFTGKNQWNFYTKVRFKKTKTVLQFYPNLKNKIFWRIANRWPRFYEEHLAWIFPAWVMHFELETLK